MPTYMHGQSSSQAILTNRPLRGWTPVIVFPQMLLFVVLGIPELQVNLSPMCSRDLSAS